MIHIMIELDHHVVFATDRNVHTDLKFKVNCLWPNVLSYTYKFCCKCLSIVRILFDRFTVNILMTGLLN